MLRLSIFWNGLTHVISSKIFSQGFTSSIYTAQSPFYFGQSFFCFSNQLKFRMARLYGSKRAFDEGTADEKQTISFCGVARAMDFAAVQCIRMAPRNISI